jgi:oligopeptide transport system ATP-binding protein
MGNETKTPLVEIKGLKKYFSVGGGKMLKAVDDVDMEIYEGETMGLVGESGCGKSTFGRVLTRIYPQTAGSYKFDGKEVPHRFGANKVARLSFTKNVQMIFQDPYASLDPRMTVGSIIAEGIDIHGLYTGEERKKRVYELLELVGLNKEHANRFPHEFSGGQRQRVGIARALAIEPKFDSVAGYQPDEGFAGETGSDLPLHRT